MEKLHKKDRNKNKDSATVKQQLVYQEEQPCDSNSVLIMLCNQHRE
jgi:hypothetical protein